MPDLSAKRTLVKSPPELWEELSEVDRLASHLEAFGEIRITKLEPERSVAWEGESASGTVSLEPSGWGTKVTLQASLALVEPEPEPQREPAPWMEAEPEPEPEPGPEPEPEPEPESPTVELQPVTAAGRRGWGRIIGGWFTRPRTAAAVEQAAAPEPEAVAVAEAQPEPEPPPPPPPAPEPEPAIAPEVASAALEDALEALGSAHHRPFSRG